MSADHHTVSTSRMVDISCDLVIRSMPERARGNAGGHGRQVRVAIFTLGVDILVPISHIWDRSQL